VRKGLALALLAGGAMALRRRRGSRRPERVDLFFDDGSSVSLDARHAEAARLLPLAQAVLTAARGRA
jgi:hypothetical protein